MSDIILDNAEKVIAAFGGIRPMAKKLGVAVTTVQGWKERGTIPIVRLDEIKEAARKEGIDLMAAVQDGASDAPEDRAGASATGARATGSVPPSGTHGTGTQQSAAGASTSKADAEKPDAPQSDAAKRDAQDPEPARAERVRPVPEAGVAAAETADNEPGVIEEEIVEYEERGWRTRILLFGIGFGFAVAIGFAGAWYLGAFDQTARLSDKDRAAWEARFSAANDARVKLEGQLTKVERQLAETSKALATANASLAELRKSNADPAKQIDGLRAQVAELTKRIDALPRTAGDTGAIAKLDERMRAIEKQMTALSSGEGKAAEALNRETARLRESLSAAEKRLTALETRVGRLAPGGGYGAMVIAIGQLRDTALAGHPFKAELARVRVLAKNYPEIVKLTAPLEPVAEDGVASRTALVEGFSNASTTMLRAATQDVEGDWIDRAWGRVRATVTIRRTGRDVAGTTPAALVTRAENTLADGKLGEALSLVGRLPAGAREAGQTWVDAARKRLQAETALDRLQAAVLQMVTGTNGTGTEP